MSDDVCTVQPDVVLEVIEPYVDVIEVVSGIPGLPGPEGPPGPPGPGVTDLITAKGDMVAGTGPEAAAIITVGADGEYLTPDPTTETGLAWKPLPEGVKAYANLAEAEAVRTSEVGTLWVPSMNAAFYSLSMQWDAFKVAGPAELVITTTVTDSLAVIGTKKYVLQEFHVRAAATEYQEIHRVARVFEFDTQSGVTTPPTPVWNILPDLPGYGQGAAGQVAVTDPYGKWSSLSAVADNVLIGDANGNWSTKNSTPEAQVQSIMRRDEAGRAKVVDPAVALDIANKGYVDGAIGAIPPAPPEPPASETVAGIARYSTQGEVDAGTDLASTVRPGTLAPYVASQIAAAPVAPHTHPEIGGTHRFLFDATPAGDPGTGRLSVENVGGQSRLLRVSKTDADGGTVNLAPLAIGDSAILSGEGATPTIFARGFAITVVTDAVTHWEFTVQRESGVGALPADATPLLLNVTLANGAGSSTGLPTPDALDQMIISVPGVAPTPFDWGKVRATHVIGGPGDVLGTIMRRNSTDATVEVGDPARIHDAVNLQSMDRAIAALPVAIPAWAPNTQPFLALPVDTIYVTTPDTPGLILVDGGGDIRFQELGKSYIVRHTGVTPNPTNFTAYSNNGRGPGRITPGQSILVYTGTDPIPVTNFTLLDGAVFRASPGIPDSNAQVITNADSGKLYSTGAGIWNVSLVNPGPVALNSPIVLWPLNGCVLTITPDTTAIGPRVISEGPVRLDWDYNTWVIEPMFTPPTPPTWGRWSGTQVEYDAIAVKDPNTLYVVV